MYSTSSEYLKKNSDLLTILTIFFLQRARQESLLDLLPVLHPQVPHAASARNSYDLQRQW